MNKVMVRRNTFTTFSSSDYAQLQLAYFVPRFLADQDICAYSYTSSPAIVPTRLHIQCLSPVKRSARKPDHSAPSNTEQ